MQGACRQEQIYANVLQNRVGSRENPLWARDRYAVSRSVSQIPGVS